MAAKIKERVTGVYHSIRFLIDAIPLDIIAAYAARATLFIVISFFPFMIMLLSLLQYLPVTNIAVSDVFLEFVPDHIRGLITSMINEISQNTGGAVLPVAAVTALWSASTGILSLVKGMNAVYKRQETRNFLIVRGMSVVYTLIFMVILIAVLIVLVFGSSICRWLKRVFPLLTDGLSMVIGARAIGAIIILTLFFIMLYKTVPNRKIKWYRELPGAVLAASLWMAFSYLYSLYIETMSRASRIYGSLTAVVLLLIWLYACMYILFIGAQVNIFLEKGIKGESADA